MEKSQLITRFLPEYSELGMTKKTVLQHSRRRACPAISGGGACPLACLPAFGVAYGMVYGGNPASTPLHIDIFNHQTHLSPVGTTRRVALYFCTWIFIPLLKNSLPEIIIFSFGANPSAISIRLLYVLPVVTILCSALPPLFRYT